MFHDGLLLSGGDILTFDPEFPRGRALIVVDGRVVFVGDDLDLAPLREATKRETDFRVVDLDGAVVVPGAIGAFHDLGADTRALDHPILRGIASGEALVEHVEARARTAAPGAWLLGREAPTALASLDALRERLDRVAPRNPVCLLGSDESWGIVNGLALRVAQGSRLDDDLASGAVRSAHGTLNGIVRGTLLHKVRRALPQPTAERWAKLAENVLQQWSARGWTAASDLGGCRVHALVGALRAHRELPLRLRTSIRPGELDAAIRAGVRSATGDGILRRGELVVDGTDLESTAAGEIADWVSTALDAGIATCFVARTSPEVTQALDLLAPHKAKARFLRHRVVAIGAAAGSDVRRAEALPVRLVFDITPEGGVCEAALDALDRGALLGFAVASGHPNPWAAYGAYAGQRSEPTAAELYASQLKSERFGVGWGGGAPLGSLREGAMADFTVLERDPFTAGAQPRVLATFCHGRPSFEQPGWTKR